MCWCKPNYLMLFIVLLPAVSLAESMDEEIDYLINSVGRDGCSFIRNDRRYSGREARQHLRSKRELNAHLIDSTEDFIEKLASTSATTREPYLIRCQGQQQQTANAWFSALLDKRRSGS